MAAGPARRDAPWSSVRSSRRPPSHDRLASPNVRRFRMTETLTTTPEARAEREARMRERVEEIYEEVTDGLTRSLRMAELVYAAAERHPDLLPSRAAIDAERELLQKDKEGLEIDQGVFLAHVLAHP